jgi:hypothetical protein
MYAVRFLRRVRLAPRGAEEFLRILFALELF